MARHKNRDRIAGPNDLTVSGLLQLARESDCFEDKVAAEILRVMVFDTVGIKWDSHDFIDNNGEVFKAWQFMQTHGNYTPICRTLTNFIQPLIVGKSTTRPQIGTRVITRFADPQLNFDSVKNPDADEFTDFNCTCC